MNGWTLVGLLGNGLSHVNPQNASQSFKEILYSVFRLVSMKNHKHCTLPFCIALYE